MKRCKRFLIILAGVAAVGIAASAQRGTSNDRFDALDAYSREHRGEALLIVKGEKTIYESYVIGRGGSFPWFLASGTKSFSGAMCAAAIEDGLISGFDEKVSDTITEWKGDPRRSKITIRQLLSLTSGISSGQIGSVPSYADAVRSPSIAEPGERFAYGPVPFQIFGELMKRKLKDRNETVYAYLKRRILDPIGLKPFGWRGSDADPLLPQGASMTAGEWAKFGILLKNGGNWNGKQIIAKRYLDELVKGTNANPGYGITFWLNAEGKDPAGRPRGQMVGSRDDKRQVRGGDVYMAAGAGDQRLYVIPSLDVVVVRFGFFGGFDDREFLDLLIKAL